MKKYSNMSNLFEEIAFLVDKKIICEDCPFRKPINSNCLLDLNYINQCIFDTRLIGYYIKNYNVIYRDGILL